MRAILLASLFAAPFVHAHPHESVKGHLARRAVDVNAFRLPQKAAYTDSKTTPDDTTEARFVAADAADYVDIATRFLEKTVPGATFRVVTDHYTGDNQVSHVNFKQTANGLDIDNADFNVNVKDGKVFSFGNSFYTGEIPSAAPIAKREAADPIDALKGVAAVLQVPISADAATVEAKEGKEIYAIKGATGIDADAEARLVYFQQADGSIKLTWRVETDISEVSNWLLTYIDAETKKEVLGVVDYSADATYQVYPWGLNDPTEGSRQSLVDPFDKTASEFGWQSIGTTSYTTTRGNNGIAQTNPSGGTAYLNNYRPTSSNNVFQYAYSPTSGAPSQYVDASVTQLFYTANTYHDLLYTLGFNERAGNFESNVNGQGGVGGDPVVLNAQDGSGTNNANFATPPDGQSGRMRMYLWTSSTPNRDCTFDQGVVVHEFSHGLSNRLTGGPANSGCLSSTESGGMGEGWSDFMATAVRLKAADTRTKNYGVGDWIANKAGGIRAYQYSTSLTTNPLTYTSVNGMTAVHQIGTVWASMLYEVLWGLIGKYGKNDAAKPTFTSPGLPSDGKYLAMKLVMDGMALQPCNPNFVQARDAIIDADEALTGGANACILWSAFAKRGLGSGARYGTTRTGSTTIPSGVC
ncbi:fungalysin metallopeptidase [Elsinoe ampelina]|uniref:Extracellular metalloproteinase n=1 Tax=Elsinoe ampelina TaxID=302913 RepID=A0A6A6FXU3_9PEZI|nr:fungalysin metallopeptidase [Elsinoe ampelina]